MQEVIKEVIMPDGEGFSKDDWNMYNEKFIKIPVVIEALRLECPVKIKTLEGEMIGNPGDWLVKGTASEYYSVKNEIFKKIYKKYK